MEKIRVIMFILLTLIFVGSCSQSNSIRVGSQKELKAKIETMREGDSINVSKLSKVSKDIFDINEVQTRIRESRRYDYSFALFINVKPLQSVHIYLEDVTHSITSLNSRNFILIAESDGWVDHDSYVSSMNPYSKTIETILLLSIADFRGDMGSVAKYTFVMVDVETNKIVAKKTITITR